MLQLKIIVSVLLLLLSATWLSTARLHPATPQLDAISTLKASVATTATSASEETKKTKTLVASTTSSSSHDDGKSKKKVALDHVVEAVAQIVRVKKDININISESSRDDTFGLQERKRSLRSRLSSEEFDNKGFVAFSSDYHAPRHHPPKNN